MSFAETQSLVFDGRGGVVIALRPTGGEE